MKRQNHLPLVVLCQESAFFHGIVFESVLSQSLPLAYIILSSSETPSAFLA